MKIVCTYIVILLVAVACQQSTPNGAQQLMGRIEQLYQKGSYQVALDSIALLRKLYPTAIAERRKALKIWQQASLKLVQADIAKTDSALQTVKLAVEREPDLRKRNFLRVKRDSLQARYEGLCGTVRVIHKKQQEL